MKKTILVINGTKQEITAVDFACFIARLTNSWLTVIYRRESDPQAGLVNRSIFTNKELSEACQKRGVNHVLQLEHNASVAAIIEETRFADLLIMDPELSFAHEGETSPTRLVKQILAESECPVILSPIGIDGVDELLFTYDGSKSSVFAIKQFSYLFPELGKKKITILQVNEKNDRDIIAREKLQALLQTHYSTINFKCLDGNAGDELFAYLLGKKNIFVVMGAFGRNPFSEFFKHSTAELMIKTLNLPVFISHQ